MTIKEAREAKGVSQEYVAEKLEIYQGAVCHWEKGKTRPSKRNLTKLCRLLGVEEHELELKERTR